MSELSNLEKRFFYHQFLTLVSDIMSRYKRFFSPDYVALIHAGEQAGNLLKALNLAIEQERFQRNFRDRIKNTLIYPFLVFVLVCTNYSITIWFTYPIFADYYHGTGGSIPWIVKIIHASGRYSLFPAAFIMVMIFILFRQSFRMQVHDFMLKVPLLRTVLIERFIASFSEGMAILLKGGVSFPEAFALLARVTGNRRLASDLEKAAASAREGADFKDILCSMPVFSNLFITAVASGEQTGTLPDSLSTDFQINNFTALSVGDIL